MSGERENKFEETKYGTLVLRSYSISGNDIDAFYDANDNLIFVLDKTIGDAKPNVLLVINPDSDKKWDEILSSEYGVDLESVRPKQDNKYQKLDIEYSGLPVYENLIKAHISGNNLDDNLVQLNILRESASRHSAMMRLNTANEIITRTNVTIVKTKESIVRLETKLKTLRAKLSDMKKEIGRVAPKQSAAKILRTESQIDATKEKIKRAKKRLESAQKRLEIATVDAKLASDLLNRPGMDIKQPTENKSMIVAPKHEIQAVAPNEEIDENVEEIPKLQPVADGESKKMTLKPVDNDEVKETKPDFDVIEDDEYKNDDDSSSESKEDDVKPLFDKDPEILDEDIAFKPISFESPDLPTEMPSSVSQKTLKVPDSDNDVENVDNQQETLDQTQPVLESLTPIVDEPLEQEPVVDESIAHEEIKEEGSSSIEKTFDVDDISDDSTETDKDVATESVPAEDSDRPRSPIISEPAPGASAPMVVAEEYTDGKPHKSSFLYYMLLLVLIGLSVFALWLYQKNMGNIKPILFPEKQPAEAVVPETPVEATKSVDVETPVQEEVQVVVEEKVSQPIQEEPESVQNVSQKSVQEDSEPFIMNAISDKISAFSNISNESDTKDVVHEAVINKPVYGTSEKHKEMFVYEEDNLEDSEYDEEYSEPTGFYVEQSQTDYYPESDELVDLSQQSQTESVVEYNTTSPIVEYKTADNYTDGAYEDSDVFYDDYDPEEEAYQAGDDGYEEYR